MEIKTPRCAISCVLRSNQSSKQTASLERQEQALQSCHKGSLPLRKICGLLRAQQLAFFFSFSLFSIQYFLVWCTGIPQVPCFGLVRSDVLGIPVQLYVKISII